MKPKHLIGIGFFASFLWVAWGIVGCQGWTTSSSPTSNQPFRNLGDSAHYVGINACKGCHSDKHATFIETGMGMSFHKAEKAYSKANFVGVKPVYDKKLNLFYFPYWEDGSMYIQEFRLQGRDTTHNRREKITHIIGSGQHTNSHFWMDGNHLYQAPLTYYTQKGLWDLPPGYEEFNTRFNRKIDIECMSCHTGMPQTKLGAVNVFEKLPLGIDCERCHGPGSLHIKEKTSGIIYNTNKQADYSIVNPKRLPWKLQVDICQRCHLQGNNVLKPGKKFTDFRPGMHLDSIFTVFMPTYQGDAKFVMAGHAERFQQSACFKGSNKGDINQYNANINFTCINCHNPHVSVKKTNQERFNQTCINCHNDRSRKSKLKDCSLSNAQRIGKTCVNCHMPSSDTRDIPHVSIHDHYIAKSNAFNPNKPGKTLGKQGKLLGLHAVNSTNPSNTELLHAYITYFEKFDANALYLNEANRLLAAQHSSENNEIDATILELQIHHDYNAQRYEAMIDLWEQSRSEKAREVLLKDAWTQYRMAVAYDKWENASSQALNTKNTKAIQHYQNAFEAMPLNTDFLAKYTNALVRAIRVEEAKSLILEGLKHQPKHEELLLNLGYCYYAEKQWNKAIESYNKALALNPESQAILSLIDIYLNLGDKEKAKRYYDRAKPWADPKLLRGWSF